MPVTSHHPVYEKFVAQWRKCRVVVEGEDSVKAAGTAYLPMLCDQEKGEYEAYKARASFYNAAGRTVEGLAGAVTRKQADVKVPKSMEDLLKTVGVKHQPLEILIKESLEEVLTVTRLGMHVDAPEGANPTPFVALYYAEDVINWQKQVIDGKEEFTLVVIAEKKAVRDEKDPFVMKLEDRWRVLRLLPGRVGTAVARDGAEVEVVVPPVSPDDASWTYVVEVWREKKQGDPTSAQEKYEIESTVVPKRQGGKAFDRIKFQFVTGSGVTDEVEEPIILDLANVNLSHYRNSADYEHGLHFTALPTVWVAGFDAAKTGKLRVGANNAWVTENHEAACGMLEFSGAGMQALKDNMDTKKQEMAVLGARLLEEQKKAAEAAETHTLRQAGEQSILSNVARSVSDGWTQALKWVAEWLNQPVEDVSVVLSQDFVTVQIDAPTLAQISADVQAGLTSWDTYFYNLKRAEMVPDNVDAEEERKLIEKGVPMAPPTPNQEFELQKQQEAAKAAAALKQTPPAASPAKTGGAAAA